MVKMLATVRDKKGHLINNLAKDDFAVEQDGHAQTITYFAQESNQPLTLGLLVDTSLSQRRVWIRKGTPATRLSSKCCATIRTRRS